MKPTVGRIVHYSDSHGDHQAAIVAFVQPDDCLNLTVCRPDAHTDAQRAVPQGDVGASRTWHWPEREDQ